MAFLGIFKVPLKSFSGICLANYHLFWTGNTYLTIQIRFPIGGERVTCPGSKLTKAPAKRSNIFVQYCVCRTQHGVAKKGKVFDQTLNKVSPHNAFCVPLKLCSDVTQIRFLIGCFFPIALGLFTEVAKR